MNIRKQGIEAKDKSLFWWKVMGINDLFQWRWIFIGDGLGRMTIGSHNILSYHVPFHNMLKWIILIQICYITTYNDIFI
jgi:hypothetical protein